jgi:phospholipase C
MLFRRPGAAALIAALILPVSACSNNNVTPHAPPGSIQALVHKKIKHVFVIVQENHTFDNYFGLYPGTGGVVENLGTSTAQADDCVPDPMAGSGACQRPFLITTNAAQTPYYVPDAPDIAGGNNSRFGQQYAIDGGKMDNFLVENETSNPVTTAPTALPANPTAAEIEAHNSALNILATYDCNTVPYLWYYAKNFTLFDHYFQANTGQSTPGNVQLFAAQMGQTEVAAGKEPDGVSTLAAGTDGYSNGLPLGNDGNPPNSQLPFLGTYAGVASQTLSVASMPVLLNPAGDAAAVSAGVTGLIPDDIALEAKADRPSTQWAWYEEGATAGDGAPSGTWSPHHTAPLYFDYINNARSGIGTSSTMRDNTYSNGLLSDVKSGSLSSQGVYWVKGGASGSTFPFKPADANLTAAGTFQGDDDHPGSGDSDHQVAEAYVATLINAIASSKYWNDSVIILTWDDSGGLYDHLPPTEYGKTCPDDVTGTFAGEPCGEGVRLPMLVISPYAKTGVVVNDPSDGGSVSKFIEDVFALPKLASLPDEAAGVAAGLAPEDANSAISDLTGALDIDKLAGSAPLISGSVATIPGPAVPPAMNCGSLGITPIASPATPPPGFVTQGGYVSASPADRLRRLPQPNDDAD